MARKSEFGQEVITPRDADRGGAANDAATGELEADTEALLAALQREMIQEGSAICILDRNGQVIYTNKAFRRIAKPLAAVGSFPGKLRAALQEREWPGLEFETSESVPQEVRISVNGQHEYYHQQHWEIEDSAGNIAATGYVFECITRLKSATWALAEATARLDDITRLVSDWVWECDPTLNLTFISPRVSDALGFHPREMKGKALTELPAKPCRELQDLIDGNQRRPFRNLEVEITNKAGELHLFRLSGLPVYSPHTGEFLGMRGTAENVTQLRAREEALVQAKELAELASRAKTEFLANMSHELRTPLNAVIGFSEIMESELLGPLGNPQYKSYANDIRESAEHLLNLINDILDVAKVEAGGHKLDLDIVSPYELADAVCRLVAERAKRANQTLEVKLPEGLPRLRIDERKVKQVLLNLLSNSVKFTADGGTIEVSARRDINGGFTFVVSDTGIGIAEENIMRAFSPFEQIDSSLNRQYEGTGLGLPLSLGFMKMHGGGLDLDSTPGVGTKAYANLPAACIVDENAP